MIEKFNKYINCKDKFDSLYIFVVYNTNYEDLNEKVKKIIKTLDNISDNKRKIYLKNRIYEFELYLEKNLQIDIINKIYFVGSEINYELLEKKEIETLKLFDHQKISYVYSNNYDIGWLNDLLYNRDYYNIFQIKNNDINYFILNDTKKKTIYKNTIKQSFSLLNAFRPCSHSWCA